MTDPVTELHAQIAAVEAEAAELDTLLSSLEETQWRGATPFKQWTPWDVVAHLHRGDTMGFTTLHDPEAYRAMVADAADSGLTRLEHTRRWLGDIDGATLHAMWRDGCARLCDAFRHADPSQRLAWSGPGMRPRMFVTARQMETWAHGWAIYEAVGATHPPANDRLYSIATLGVRTFGWTFANRGDTPPGPPPKVHLRAPSGAQWVWNEDNESDFVSGNAEDFCLVVTQVRNVADVALRVHGNSASAWMALAQCFAGPPETPPAPGSRQLRG